MSGRLDPAADTVPTHPGRIVVRDRVFVKVAEEVAASAFRVERGTVSVEVSESHSGIAVSISTPLPITRLDDTEALLAGVGVVDRVTAIQSELKNRISHITGREVYRVNITVTGAVTAPQRRVR